MGNEPDDLDRLLAAVEAQQRSIERLVAVLERREQQAPRPPDQGAPAGELTPTLINWLEIAGPQRLAAWEGLAAFVESLVVRYSLQIELRPCWWQHADAVDELTALWHVRYTCFADPTNLGGAMTWLDALQKSRDRLRDMFQSCRDSHVDSAIGTWMRDDIRRAFHAAVQKDVYGPDRGHFT